MRQLDMNFYFENLKKRYAEATRKDKSLILSEFCNTSGCHRKHVIRLLARQTRAPKRPLGRKKEYLPEELLPPLRQIWLATDQMCGKRLKVAMPLWLPYYNEAHGKLDEGIRARLLRMSAATIDRLLKPLRTGFPRGLGGTKPGSLLRQHIPIKTDQWNESQPGFVEGDTVAHCGTSLLGNFVWSVTVTDIFSGWTENGATWNKGAHGVMEQIRLIEERLPFTITGWDSDNGGEFLNHHLVRYFQDRENSVQFTRSRPYHSGDNAHVEQKNWTHVRQLFGYYRFEDPRLVNLMNDIYHNEWRLLHNYFFPSIKLIDKVRIQSKMKKKYSKPQTPYQRLMECGEINDEQKVKLKQTFESLNPFGLKKAIEQKLKKVFSYVNLTASKKAGGI